MTARPPPFDCAHCQRRITKTATHYLLQDNRVVCDRCLSKPAHAAMFPACPHAWHDILDHLDTCGHRDAIAAVLGLWPRASKETRR
jgi:hypothetical protein